MTNLLTPCFAVPLTHSLTQILIDWLLIQTFPQSSTYSPLTISLSLVPTSSLTHTKSLQFWSCVHFWGCLHFWAHLPFWGNLSFEVVFFLGRHFLSSSSFLRLPSYILLSRSLVVLFNLTSSSHKSEQIRKSH